MGIVVGVILFSIMGIIFNFYSLAYLRKQQREYANNQVTLFLDDLNQELSHINYELISMVIQDGNIKELGQISVDDKSGAAIIAKYKIGNEITESFSSFLMYYSNKYNLFFYSPTHELYLAFGKSDYALRQNMKDLIKKMVADNNLPLTRQEKWFVIPGTDCLFTIYNYENYCIGSFINLQDFVEPLLKSESNYFESIKILAPDGTVFYTDDLSADVIERRHGSREALTVSYPFPKGDFTFEIVLKSNVFRNTVIFQILFFAIVFIFATGMIFIYKYLNVKLIKPSKNFYESLLNKDEFEEYRENIGIIEFEEAGKRLNSLSKENIQLRLNIYEEQMQRQQVELDFISQQIKPHFFINCLDSIYNMAQMMRTEEIQQLTLYVSDFLRGLLRKGMTFISLDEELKLIDRYLKIQRIIYGNDFDYCFNYDEGLRKEMIPPLIIQTFVENSMKYGNARQGKTMIGIDVKSQITIDNTEAGEKILLITVIDNGLGFEQGMLKQLADGELVFKDETRQLGIINVIQRLKLIYGHKGTVALSNQNNGGAKVEISIPMQKNGETE